MKGLDLESYINVMQREAVDDHMDLNYLADKAGFQIKYLHGARTTIEYAIRMDNKEIIAGSAEYIKGFLAAYKLIQEEKL